MGDFGLAVMQDKAGLLTRSLRGWELPGYRSTEQQYGLKIDERTDQYSLSALGYELLYPTPSSWLSLCLPRDIILMSRAAPHL